MKTEFKIETATRQDAPVSVYIEGESGSGKTYSALLLARGLAGDGKIGVIDTEGRRALVYADDADIGGFEHMEFAPPYSPQRFIEALDVAVAAGWAAIILDSASLEHDGEGGLLDMADQEADRLTEKNPNNRAISQQKWTKPKLAHKRFLNHAVGLPAHVIFCVRQTLTTDFKSKPPTSVLSPVIEKNTKFALELHASIGADHRAHWTRLPKPYLPSVVQDSPITVETGRKLANREPVRKKLVHTDDGKTHLVLPMDDPGRDEQTKDDIAAMIRDSGVNESAFNVAISKIYKGKFDNWKKLPPEHLSKLATEKGFAAVLDKAMG